jgi:hypothetical protein
VRGQGTRAMLIHRSLQTAIRNQSRHPRVSGRRTSCVPHLHPQPAFAVLTPCIPPGMSSLEPLESQRQGLLSGYVPEVSKRHQSMALKGGSPMQSAICGFQVPNTKPIQEQGQLSHFSQPPSPTVYGTTSRLIHIILQFCLSFQRSNKIRVW